MIYGDGGARRRRSRRPRRSIWRRATTGSGSRSRSPPGPADRGGGTAPAVSARSCARKRRRLGGLRPRRPPARHARRRGRVPLPRRRGDRRPGRRAGDRRADRRTADAGRHGGARHAAAGPRLHGRGREVPRAIGPAADRDPDPPREQGREVSGAWEGAGDTLLHATVHARGKTTLHFQKARWSSEWHKETLDLDWTDGEGFEVAE